jgi:thiol-disulfide isomerase/thioredoxin
MSLNATSAQDLVSLGQWKNGLIVLNFWAAWSEPSKQLTAIMDQLAKQYHSDSSIKFVHVRFLNNVVKRGAECELN